MSPATLVRAVLCLLSTIPSTAPALAGAAEFAFEPVNVEVKTGPDSELLVRLVHKPTGKPVEGALIVKTRLDMAPDKMEGMTATHSVPEPAGEPGVYRIRAHLGMAGGWALKLMAKIQGEPETVIGTVVFRAGN